MRGKEIFKSVFLIMIVSLLLSNANRYVMAATKLGEDDFVAEVNSKTETWSFFDVLSADGVDEGVRGFVYDEAYDKSKKGVVSTARGINIGSKLSTVTKKYGKGTKGSLSKDIVYKGLPDDEYLLSYFSSTEYVLTYKFVEKIEGGGEFISRIHFYIDKNDKVSGIFFSRVFIGIKE
jgi:hypothetical protein